MLVIGAGPSGMDIVAQLSKVATRITFSQFKRPNETKEEREKRQSLRQLELNSLMDHMKHSLWLFLQQVLMVFDLENHVTN